MTDKELIARLRDVYVDNTIRLTAADRIEALNAKLDQAKAALREIKSVECIHCTDLFNELADAVLGEANGDGK